MDYSHDFAPQQSNCSSESSSSDSDDGVDGGISEPALDAKSWLNNFFSAELPDKLALPPGYEHKSALDLKVEETVQKIKEQRKSKKNPLGRKLFFFPKISKEEEIEA